MRYAFFKGCFLPVRLPHIENVAGEVLGSLGIDLVEIKGFSCCPEPVGVLTNDRLTGMALAARNIAIAEEEGLDIITLCNGCTYTLKQVNAALKGNEGAKREINEVLAETGHQFEGTAKVRHFASVLTEDIGLDGVASKVERPLKGLRVAGHTGCHIVSPPEVMKFDDPLDPFVLDRLTLALGAEPMGYSLKTLCCGWTLTNYGDKEGAHRLLGDKLNAMREVGSECISVICPQCFYQFDTGQLLASRRLDLDFKIPVLFYLQLLGLAMGYTLDDVGYPRNRSKGKAFEDRIMEVLG
ncbi:MAG: heterodisulfide reductase-related iron-sulfur binding cluster [Candidatus Bathyarchaeota archaeon]|jgi:heterodisulfide reductase subunit B